MCHLTKLEDKSVLRCSKRPQESLPCWRGMRCNWMKFINLGTVFPQGRSQWCTCLYTGQWENELRKELQKQSLRKKFKPCVLCHRSHNWLVVAWLWCSYWIVGFRKAQTVRRWLWYRKVMGEGGSDTGIVVCLGKKSSGARKVMYRRLGFM